MVPNRKIALTCCVFTLLVTLVSISACFVVSAQTITNFTPANPFAIPANNGTISFARSGTYQTASLGNGSWSFVNLRLNNASQTNFTVSVQNSNINITTCRVSFTSLFPGQVNYRVVGQGTQIVNLGRLRNGYWTVSINQKLVSENHGWSSSANGTVTVTGAASGSNVSIVFNYGVNRDTSNQPFIQQHSVLIATGIALAAVAVLALAIREVIVRKQGNRLDQNSPVENQ